MNSTATQGISLAERQPAYLPRQLKAILISSTSAILADVIFYLLATELLGIPMVALEQFPPPELSPLPVTDVVIFSFVFSFGASLVFLLVANISQRPAQVYLAICLVVLILPSPGSNLSMISPSETHAYSLLLISLIFSSVI